MIFVILMAIVGLALGCSIDLGNNLFGDIIGDIMEAFPLLGILLAGGFIAIMLLIVSLL